MIKIKIKAHLIAQKQGIKIFIGHAKKNIKNATIVVKSSAIKDNNVEIKQAKKIKYQFIQELKF